MMNDPKDFFGNHKRILWIGAHPDDELAIASSVAPHTRLDGVEFHMVNITHGEGSPKWIEGERENNAVCSAIYFGGTHEFYEGYRNRQPKELGDSIEQVIRDWSGLEENIWESISRFKPTLVITIHPEYAFGGHIEHKVLLHFLKLALKCCKISPKILLATSIPIWTQNELSIVAPYNSDLICEHGAKHTHNVYRIHSNQFSLPTLAKLTDVQASSFDIYCP